jgi:hypothetical protein
LPKVEKIIRVVLPPDRTELDKKRDEKKIKKELTQEEKLKKL